MIVDSDRVYVHKRLNLALASRITCVRGLRNYGVLSYFLGRTFRDFFYPRATPVMYSGVKIDLRLLLEVAEVADKVRGVGAGRTVFEMARRFGVGVGEVTWEMLSSIPHYPIVVVKFIREELHRRDNTVKSITKPVSGFTSPSTSTDTLNVWPWRFMHFPSAPLV